MTKPHIDLNKFRSMNKPGQPNPSGKRRKRLRDFAPVLIALAKRLKGVRGQAVLLMVVLSYLNWRNHGSPIKLTNKLLEDYGISRETKRVALANLEDRGLIRVERRSHKSPLVWLISNV
jgi:hypothetical protein